jgi:hypothetical protein
MTGVSPIGGSATAGFGHSPYSAAAEARILGAGGRERRRAPQDWEQALDELEGDVLDAQELLARDRAEEIANWGRRSEDWIPPQGLGPVPPDLRERAAQLLQHQLAVAEQLAERIVQSQRQRDVAARMSYAPSRPVASYIDRGL